MSSDSKYDFAVSNIFIMIERMLLLVAFVTSIFLFDRGDIQSPLALLPSKSSTGSNKK
jgi:hypothetical protein